MRVSRQHIAILALLCSSALAFTPCPTFVADDDAGLTVFLGVLVETPE